MRVLIASYVMLAATTLLLFFGAPLGSFETRTGVCDVQDMIESGTLPSPAPHDDQSPVTGVDKDEVWVAVVGTRESAAPGEMRTRKPNRRVTLPKSPDRDVARPPPR